MINSKQLRVIVIFIDFDLESFLILANTGQRLQQILQTNDYERF